MLKDNQHYFKISKDNPESHLDDNYFVIEKHPELKEYVKNIKEIKEILITIKKLKEEKEGKLLIEKYFVKLFESFSSNFANCSELGCFVNACDTTRDLIQGDYESFKKVTNLFIKKREINERVPENWVQAIIDSNSSRKKGELGERKLIKILSKKGFVEVKNWDDFHKNKKCVARFSEDVFPNSSVRENLHINMEDEKQEKMLDLIIKIDREIFLLEAKHLNVGGGEQNKQVSELIDILKHKEDNKNIHYIAFLDGTYSNLLLAKSVPKRAKKRIKQRKDIEKFLIKNKNSFWMNTSAFSEFVKDLS